MEPPDPVLGGLFPLFPPDGLPVVLGALRNPLDFAIIKPFIVNPIKTVEFNPAGNFLWNLNGK